MKRFYSVLMPLRMADDPIPTGESAPVITAPVSANALHCEFCECRLAKDGSVLTVGKRAKKMRDLEDDVEARDAVIVERDAEITRLKRELADTVAKLPKKSAWG